MARTDVETLVVRLEAQIRSFEREMARARGLSDRNLNNIENRFNRANKNIASGFARLGAVSNRALGALGIGLSIKETIALTDQYTALQNALKIAGLSGEELSSVYNRLLESAQRNLAPVDSLVRLYGRIAQSQKELKVSSEEMIKFSDGIAVALRVGGTSAQEASGALLQLSQALAGGIVRAEEFNSINEGALPILQAVAKGLDEAGGSVGKLRRLVTDGKVSSEAFFRSFLAGLPALQQQVKSADVTIGQSFTALRNELINTIGTFDKTTGATKFVTTELRKFGDDISAIPGYVTAVNNAIDQVASRFSFLTGAVRDTNDSFRSFLGLMTANERVDKAFAPLPGQAAGSSKPTKVTVTPVHLADFPASKSGKSGKGGAGGSSVDEFKQAIEQAQKRIAVTQADTATIGLNSEARDRARLIIELETAAKKANADAGMRNTEVTAAQRQKINELADAMEQAAQRERVLQEAFQQFDRVADEAADAFTGWVTGSQTASEAFRGFANSVISDLIRMQAKSTILSLFGLGSTGGVSSLGTGLASLFGGARAEGGPVQAGRSYVVGERGPELFTPGRSGVVTPNSVVSGRTVNSVMAPISIAVDARGAAPDQAATLAATIERRLTARIVPTVREAISRGAL